MNNSSKQKQQVSLERFVENARAKYGNKFDYSLVQYKNNKTPVEIICPEHGSFWQKPDTHLHTKYGCKQCGVESSNRVRTKTNEQFIQEAIQVHGDIYDYSQVDYVYSMAKVDIICPTHGVFSQLPSAHLQGWGCKLCNSKFYPRCDIPQEQLDAWELETRKQSFLRKAKELHGDHYDYSKIDFKRVMDKVEIICPEHGSFWQRPMSHIAKGAHGCKACATLGFDYQASAILYLLKFQKDYATFWKIGITNRSVKRRYMFRGEYKTITEQTTWKFATGWDAFRAEQEVMKTFASYRMQFLFPLLTNYGDSECFTLKLPVHKVKSFVDSLKTQGACLLSD